MSCGYHHFSTQEIHPNEIRSTEWLQGKIFLDNFVTRIFISRFCRHKNLQRRIACTNDSEDPTKCAPRLFLPIQIGDGYIHALYSNFIAYACCTSKRLSFWISKFRWGRIVVFLKSQDDNIKLENFVDLNSVADEREFTQYAQVPSCPYIHTYPCPVLLNSAFVLTDVRAADAYIFLKYIQTQHVIYYSAFPLIPLIPKLYLRTFRGTTIFSVELVMMIRIHNSVTVSDIRT